ncbi:MAG: hypothetical protein HYX60_01635 [Legionella longbeachae]|nr:hypothetical protein [Legionella longbeachae]
MKKQILVAAALFTLSSSNYADPLTSTQINEMVTNDNKTLPAMVDKETKLLKESVDSSAFHYNYQIINMKAKDIDTNQFNLAMKTKLQPVVCTNSFAKQLFDSGLNISFDYVDKENAPITNIVLKNSDCPATTPTAPAAAAPTPTVPAQ